LVFSTLLVRELTAFFWALKLPKSWREAKARGLFSRRPGTSRDYKVLELSVQGKV